MRLSRPSLTVYHEQIVVSEKVVFDSFKDVFMSCGLKVDLVELVVVRALPDACGDDLVSRYSITAIATILLLLVVIRRPDPNVDVKLAA